MRGWHKESYRHYLAGKGIKTSKWFKPTKHTGWKKTQARSTRLSKLMSATDKRKSLHNRRLEAARRAQALANVTADKETEVVARADAQELFKRAKQKGRNKYNVVKTNIRDYSGNLLKAKYRNVHDYIESRNEEGFGVDKGEVVGRFGLSGINSLKKLEDEGFIEQQGALWYSKGREEEK